MSLISKDKKYLRKKNVIEESNRHKWLKSEIVGYDIGFEAAAEDWLKNHAAVWIAYHENKNKQKRSAKWHLLRLKILVNCQNRSSQ